MMAVVLSGAMMLAGCSSSQWATKSNTTKGAVYGGAGGAAVGAGLGAILSKKIG